LKLSEVHGRNGLCGLWCGPHLATYHLTFVERSRFVELKVIECRDYEE
jgi:hypothetical protein